VSAPRRSRSAGMKSGAAIRMTVGFGIAVQSSRRHGGLAAMSGIGL
jgi:hypothetical protein